MSSVKKSNKGMEELFDVHTKALENNSKSVVEILEILARKDLQVKDKEALKKIRRELKVIDRKVDSLDNVSYDEESWW